MGQALVGIDRARLAQASAMSPAASGAVTGKGTATENIEAASTLDERVAFQRTQFYDLMRRVGGAMGWYCYHSQRVVQPLPPDALQDLGSLPQVKIAPDGTPYVEMPKRGVLYGGKRNGVSIKPDEYDQLQISLDSTSMSWTSDEKQLQLVQLVNEEIVTFGPLVSDPRYQHVAWGLVGKLKAKATGQAIFGKLYDLSAAAQMAQSQALQEQAMIQAAANSPAQMSGSLGVPPAKPAAKPATASQSGGRPKPTVSATASPAGRQGSQVKSKPPASNPKIEM